MLIVVLLCGCISARTEPACGPFRKAAADEDEVTRKATTAFVEHTHGLIHHYKVSRSDCADKVIIVFEGIGEDANFGNHWIIWYTKATGEIRVIDGI